MIKFGVAFFQYQPNLTYDLVKKCAFECERLGYDSLWLNDHLIPSYSTMSLFEPWFECWTTLSALASETKRLRLGTLVLCNSFRHPSILAKMAATLDVISNGRLELGLGGGWFEQEYIAYGVPYPKASIRIHQLKEAVQVIKKMWTEEEASFEGKYYCIREAACNPKPVQKPHPPIWIGGGGENLLMKVVAELADGWNLPFTGHRYPPLTPEEYRRKVDVLQKHCLSFGRNQNDIQKSSTQIILIAKNQQGLKEKIAKYKLESPRKEIKEMPTEGFIERCLVGTPQQCLEKISNYVDVGITYFILDFPDVLESTSLQLFAEHVIRAFNK